LAIDKDTVAVTVPPGDPAMVAGDTANP